MAEKACLDCTGDTGRRRVHTPGKFIVLILFAPVLLIAVGAGLWLRHKEREAVYAAIEVRTNANGDREVYYALPEFLVDLRADNDGRASYLRVKASILLQSGAKDRMARNMDAIKPLLVERLTFFLRELRPEDFAGTEGMGRVKRELLRRVNLVMAPDAASEVILEELVIQ